MVKPEREKALVSIFFRKSRVVLRSLSVCKIRQPSRFPIESFGNDNGRDER